MRKYWLDNIRGVTVLLVVVYHVFYLFNAAGVPGGIGSFRETQPWDVYCTFVYPWFMFLLFAVAGVSARYALEGQSDKAFMRAKTDRLLVPSTLGLLLFPSLVGYIYIRLGGALGKIPPALVYPISVLSGVGPLWFLHVLYLFSWLLTLARRLSVTERLYAAGERAGVWLLAAGALPVWGAAQILNLPVFTTYRFGIYLFAYLAGYFVLSHEAVQERLTRARWGLLIAAAVVGAAYNVRFYGQNFADDTVLRHPLTNLWLWLMTLAILGCGRAWLNRTGRAALFVSRTGCGVYITHYLIELCLCLALRRTALPVWLVYTLAVVCGYALSVAAYGLLRRIPVVRYLSFGIRRERITDVP